MVHNESNITINPEIMGGTPVFKGTRVPVKALSDYLSTGETIDTFLNDFPSVNREKVTAVLKELFKGITDHASAA